MPAPGRAIPKCLQGRFKVIGLIDLYDTEEKSWNTEKIRKREEEP
jgi:hypothetical protein